MDKKGGFNTIARYYDRLARLVFGAAIVNSQTFFLDKIAPSSKVLILGGGTGWWLRELLLNRPECTVQYIEASSAMIELAMKTRDSRISFRLGTEDLLHIENEFDTVITFFFLDLFQKHKLQEVIKKIRWSMKPNALWLAVDFVQIRWWHATALFIMYVFFWLITGLRTRRLPRWEEQLAENDMEKLDEKMFFGNFIVSTIYRAKN